MFCRIVQLVWFRYSMSSGQGAGFWVWDGMGWILKIARLVVTDLLRKVWS
jgi:hypothetical protein